MIIAMMLPNESDHIQFFSILYSKDQFFAVMCWVIGHVSLYHSKGKCTVGLGCSVLEI